MAKERANGSNCIAIEDATVFKWARDFFNEGTAALEAEKERKAEEERKNRNGDKVTEKLVLDACCGPKMFWFDKNDSRTIYVDCRQVENMTIWEGKSGVRTIDIMPDIVADFRKLPFENESFWHVVFDPPHLVRVGDNSWLKKKYGELPIDWKSLIKQGFSECWRVLKVNGTLIFKWNETQIPVSEVIKVINHKPLYGNKCGRQNKTHWMAFFKEEE